MTPPMNSASGAAEVVRGLTERDREVLIDLEQVNHGSNYPRSWARPLDCGGSGHNDVSYRLNKLARLGLVEFIQRQGMKIGGTAREAGMSRGSKEYRITDAGRAILKDQEQ